MLKKAVFFVTFISCLSFGCIANAAPTDIIVFIPGFGGSKLQDSHGSNVWGNLPDMVRRFADLELSQDQRKPPLISYDILDSVSIFGPFSMPQCSGILKSLGEMGYIRDKNLFLFPYDWRQSNFDTALKLKSFIEKEKKQQFEGKKITIIAHSMGGLVASIYIQKYGGDKRVGKLITLGTPYFGSLEALRLFFDGLGPIQNKFMGGLVGGRENVIRVISSFPATYELLPNYDTSCILGLHNDKSRKPIEVNDFQTWGKCGWLSAIPERKELVKQSLARAKELAILVREDPKVKTFKIVGDLIDTLSRVYLDKDNNCTPREWIDYNGDGTVPLKSAMADRPETAEAALQRHATIFNDKHVITRLKFLLTKDKWWEQYASSEIIGWVKTKPNGSAIEISGIKVDNRTPFVLPSGSVAIAIIIYDKDRNPIRSVDVTGSLINADGSSNAIKVSSGDDGVYLVTTDMPTITGLYTVKVDVPGIGALEEYVAVLDDQKTK